MAQRRSGTPPVVTHEMICLMNRSIGRTMGNMQGYVLDERMRPVPVGVIGELYFGGAHVAHGYWRRPDITAKQFLPDPFAKEPGRRLYKTGDLGRWLPDGNFEYLCRRDQQVQLRGFASNWRTLKALFGGIQKSSKRPCWFPTTSGWWPMRWRPDYYPAPRNCERLFENSCRSI